MLTYAVTGAGGMIGRHLLDALRPRGGRIQALLLPNEPEPPSSDGVEFVRGDVRDSEQMMSFVSGADVVFHLAALVGRNANHVSMSVAHEVNVKGTRNVLRAAERCNVRRFVFLSTCCVYGLHAQADDIVTEQSPHAPLRLPYDLTKTEADDAVACCDSAAVPWTILQIPVALGGAHTVGMPTALALARVATTGFVPRRLGGASWANYVFGADVAAALVLLAEHPAAVGQTFIYSESAPMHLFLSWIARELDVRCRIVPVPAFALSAVVRAKPSAIVLANRRRFAADKIKRLVGFSPPIGLEEGLRETIRHYRSNGSL